MAEYSEDDASVNSSLVLHAVESAFVTDLIYGNIVSESVIKSYLNILGIDKLPNTVFTMNIDDLSSKSFTDERKHRFEKLSILKTVRQITSGRSGAVAMEEKGGVVVLLNVSDSSSISIGQELLEQFNNETGLASSVGIGETFDSFIDCPKSYEQAKKALKHKFFLGSHKAIHISDIKKIDQNVLECFLEKESNFTNKVRIGDEAGALEVLKELLKDIFAQDGVFPDMLKVRILELLTVISRAAIEGGANPKVILELKVKYGDEIANIEHKSEFEKWINKAFCEVISYVKANQIIESVKAARLAQNYIDENYHNPLTLEDVSSYVYLSPYYFSHMFKKEVGMTFVEYLTEKRIKKAQQLLMTTDLSVSNIAVSVGYPDANYFGKVYKNVTGMTPGESRKKAKGL